MTESSMFGIAVRPYHHISHMVIWSGNIRGRYRLAPYTATVSLAANPDLTSPVIAAICRATPSRNTLSRSKETPCIARALSS